MSAKILNPNIDDGFAFPYLATEVFPLWIGAIILIAGLSATLSSGSSDYIVGVTILLRDVYQVFTGKVLDKEKMVLYSRVSLIAILIFALIFTLEVTNIIEYITNFISTYMSGLLVAAVIGKFWGRANWQGSLASIIGGYIISFIIMLNDSLSSFSGNPIIPYILGAIV